jgi:hypothetical protein
MSHSYRSRSATRVPNPHRTSDVGAPGYVPGMRRLTVTGPRGGRWETEQPTSPRDRGRGSRGRPLGVHQAMLLKRCRSVQTIGMAFPLTLAFIDASWHVVRVERAKAGRILFCRRARHVLECHIGADLRVGDVLSCWEAPRGAPATAPRGRSRPR